MKLDVKEFQLSLTIPNDFKVITREEMLKQKNIPPFVFACSNPNFSILTTGAGVVSSLSNKQTVESNFQAVLKMAQNGQVKVLFHIADDIASRYELLMHDGHDFIIQIYHFFDKKLLCFSARVLHPGLLPITTQNYHQSPAYIITKQIISSLEAL